MSIGILRQHPMISLLEEHVQRYPVMEIPDVYKLLYQGEFGVKHILHDPEAAKDFLMQELHEVPADSHEPLRVAISPDRSMVRIHLQTFKASKLNPGDLWQAMLNTAESVEGDKQRFAANWKVFRRGAERGFLPFPSKAITEFWQDMENRGFPVVHHSARYSEAYHPAYRVIKLDYLSNIV